MRQLFVVVSAAALALAAPATLATDLRVGPRGSPNFKPHWLGTIGKTYYDGAADDLLTGGLGKSGLAGAAPDPGTPPTAAGLRKRAIHTNYRAVLDISEVGGYGVFYGPNIDPNGNDTLGEGKVPGWEFLAYADDGSGRKNVTLMVQVPDSFDVHKACIVTATASGSRGVYGAIGASGEWGLKRGCAVAYTDKGTGNGLHDLMTDKVGLIDGVRVTADLAGDDSHFTAPLTDAERHAFNRAFPDRVAYKHAHSRRNPEDDWGRNTLQAVVFAFYALNELHGRDARHWKRIVLDRRNTIVIASGVSNGGTGALAAAEQDVHGLIDGVAVTEPNAQPPRLGRLEIQQGTTIVETVGEPLYDYFTFANLYQPCAALAPGLEAAPSLFLLPAVQAANRCKGLKAKGLLSAPLDGDGGVKGLAQEALGKLRGYGWGTEQDLLHASHYRFATNAIAVTYSNAYGRFSVADNLCGFSFANTTPTGTVVPQVEAVQAAIFATGNGVPPTSGVNIVYNASQLAGEAAPVPRVDLLAASPSSGLADFALDGAICHRNLVEGRDIVTGNPLTGELAEAAQRVRKGIEQVLLRARLRGTPAIIVHGRSDTLVPPNHASRAYFGRNQLAEDGPNRVRYVEVTNAQHFDAFLPSAGPAGLFAGYDTRFVPLHVYLIRALDLMYDHLTARKPLPESQVVRGVPRGGSPGAAPPLRAENIPPIVATPTVENRIYMWRNRLIVPE